MKATDHPLASAGPDAHEELRLQALARYGVLDTPPEGFFDRVTATAADLFGVPFSILCFIDRDRIWFKSRHGVDSVEIGRPAGAGDGLGSAVIANRLGLRLCAAAPLRSPDGFALGSLCVMDRAARRPSDRQVTQLEALASLVMEALEGRLAALRHIADLSRRLEEKDADLRRAQLTAREVDHRVMNSLQIVSGLLRMQGRSAGHPDVAEHLKQAARRVATIAEVHQHIHQSGGTGMMGCRGYLERLCAQLSESLRTGGGPTIAFVGDDVALPAEQLVPLGMIVNELVTNSVKHGDGRVAVTLAAAAPAGYVLTVANDGMGLPAGFDPASTPGFGMKVIAALAQQLGGELRFASNDVGSGARFSVHVATVPVGRSP